MYCIKCGEKLEENDKYCKACGYCNDVEDDETSENQKQAKRPYKLIAAALIGLAVILLAVFVVVHVINKAPEVEIASVSGDSASEVAQADSTDERAEDEEDIENDESTEDNESSDATDSEATEIIESDVGFYKPFSDEDVETEGEIQFVSSQLLLTSTEDATYSDIEELVTEYEGEIVGYISFTGDYQVDFTDKTYDELQELIEDFEDSSDVDMVMLNYVSEMGEESVDYTKDPWIDEANPGTSGSVWDESNPSGNNWWAEAIKMVSVWEMDLDLEPVKVGVYDTMFDVDNEDLDEVFVKLWNNPTNVNNSHGTHVAGIIAAEAENGFGIAGVSTNAKLYGYANKGRGTIFDVKYAIALLLNEDVKVINMSNGFGDMLEDAQDGKASAVENLECYSSSMEKFLLKYIEGGYDFIIVKAACNCGNKYDAKYDYLGAITNEEVAKHILIVGAAENANGYYSIADFSVTGDRVDVYAPGVNILSDLPSNVTGMKNGTSMATPMVTGIIALIWGVNPDLSSEQVADIVKASAYTTIFNYPTGKVMFFFHEQDDIPIVDAYFAVNLALGAVGTGTDTDISNGLVYGKVYEINDNEDANYMENVQISVYDMYGNLVATDITDAIGTYTILLDAGDYKICVEKEGYTTDKCEITLAAGDVILIEHEMTEAPQMTPEEMYAPVLEQYQTIVNDENLLTAYYEGTTEMDDYPYVYIQTFGLYYDLYSSYDDMDNFKIQYAFYDLDGDGIQEMLMSFSGGSIDCIYGCNNGEIQKVYETTTYRTYITIYTDGTVYISGSGGAASGSEEYYLYKDGSLERRAYYTYDYDDFEYDFGDGNIYDSSDDARVAFDALLEDKEALSVEWNELEYQSGAENVNATEGDRNVLYSGECGDNLTWTLDDEGLLIISGTGEMTNYFSYAFGYGPWHEAYHSWVDPVINVVIEEGVTSIGDGAFMECTSMISITIPNSVTSIGDGAFMSCSKLKEVSISDNVTEIGYSAFSECKSMPSITIPETVISMGSGVFYGWSSSQTIYINGYAKAPSGWDSRWASSSEAIIVWDESISDGEGEATGENSFVYDGTVDTYLKGTWVGDDKVYIFTPQSDTLSVTASGGVSTAGGDVIILNTRKLNETYGTYTVMNDSQVNIIYNLSNHLVSYTCDNETLTLDGEKYTKLDDAIVYQLDGEWSNGDVTITFSDGSFSKREIGEGTSSGRCYVISDSMLWVHENGESTVVKREYSVDHLTLVYGNIVLTKNGCDSSAERVHEIESQLYGKWEGSLSAEYIFYEDGICERTGVYVATYRVADEKTVYIYEDIDESIFLKLTYDEEEQTLDINGGSVLTRSDGE